LASVDSVGVLVGDWQPDVQSSFPELDPLTRTSMSIRGSIDPDHHMSIPIHALTAYTSKAT